MLPDTYATVTIGDFRGMLDRSAEMTKKINPALSSQTIRSQIGLLLRDDGMDSIPAGAGMMMVVPHEGSPFFIMETAPGKAGDVAEALKKRGRHAIAPASDGLVVFAQDQASLDALMDGKTSAAAEMLRANDDKFLTVMLDADKLTADKGDELRRAFDRQAEKALRKRPEHYTTATTTFMKLLGNYMIAVGKRTDVATLKLDISGEGVMFDRSVYPLGGMPTASPAGASAQDLRKGLAQPERVVASFDYHGDTQTVLKVMESIIVDTLADIGLSNDDMSEINNLFNLASTGYGDASSGWIGGGENKATGAIAMSLDNPEAAVNHLKAKFQSLESGALSRYHALLDLKTKATLTENAGEVAGSQFHTFTVDFEPTNDRTSKWLDSMNKVDSGKVLVQGEKMLLTLNDTSLEDQAAAASGNSGNAPELKSRATLDDGGFMYVDFYPAGLADCVTKPKMKEAIAEYGDSVISHGVYADTERIRMNCFVPADVVQKTVDGVQAMKAAKREKKKEMKDKED